MQIATSEKSIQNKILMLSRHNVRLFRANSGIAWQGLPRTINGNLVLTNISKIQLMPKGTPDLIGYRSVTITPEMVGKKMAVFTCIEVKKPGKKPTEVQQNFIDRALKSGAMSGYATNENEAKELMWMV